MINYKLWSSAEGAVKFIIIMMPEREAFTTYSHL